LTELLVGRSPDDMVVLYYSGHGIVAKGQQLYLATGQSSFDRPQARSLWTGEIRAMMAQSRAGRLVVILDCCHSGVFAEGAKGAEAPAMTEDTFGRGDGAEGQYVLTATDGLQYAYDGTGALREGAAGPVLSHFTRWLVDGIGKGEAAPFEEQITLDSLYLYLCRRARSEQAGMTPQRFVNRGAGEIVIAHNPSAKPLALPDKLLAQLASADWRDRKDAVAELGKVAKQSRMGTLVRKALRDRVPDERDRDVSDAMYELLAQLGGAPAPDRPPSVRETNTAPRRLASVRPANGFPAMWIAGGAGAVLIVIAVAVAVLWHSAPPEPAAQGSLAAATKAGTLATSQPPQAAPAAKAPSRQRPESEFKDCAECPAMVAVPAGSFNMGSPASEEGREADEGPQHPVTIARGFAAGKYEVTFAEWDACVADGGCGVYRPDDNGWGRGNHPVIDVSWDDAKSYVTWLSRKTGKQYRLLSESEWEYAARARTATSYYWGNTAEATYAKYGSSDGTAAVGSYRPNSFGLYDMLGNVWEWTEDCYHASYSGAPGDGSAWTSADCSQRVLRGGSWSYNPNNLRSAYRLSFSPGNRVNFFGFRVARTL
jgi:formylglycine-generating enzyme required for sulfatase activity